MSSPEYVLVTLPGSNKNTKGKSLVCRRRPGSLEKFSVLATCATEHEAQIVLNALKKRPPVEIQTEVVQIPTRTLR